MYLRKVKIMNYRSIDNIEIEFSKGKNVIVGRNNAGKSNIIKAIDIVLGESSPDYAKNNNITPKDFHTYEFKDENGNILTRRSNKIYIYCELKRDEHEELLYEEMRECYPLTVYKEFISDNQLQFEEIDKLFKIKKDKIENSKKKFINIRRDISELKKELDNKYIFAFVFLAEIDEEDKIHKEIRFFYRENEEAKWQMAFSTPIRNELIQSAIIPSFRDTNSQLRINQWSWYGKLLKHFTESCNKLEELRAAFKKVNDISNEIFDDLKSRINDENFLIAFPGTKLMFQLNSDIRQDIYKNAVIYIDDGFKSEITDKGAGIQSATIIGLFSYYVNYVNTKASALLCVEEPELYLHPHACRVMSSKLDKFIEANKDNNNQVIITTHNAEFLKTIKTDINVILVRKDNGKTSVKQIQMKEFKEIFLDSNQHELFFADKVIICEGYDSYILKWVAEELFPNKLNEKNVSIISANGKDNISKFIKLTMKLGIDTYVFADFDYFLRDKDKENINKYKNKGYDIKVHENITNLGEEYFVHRFGEEGNKIYKCVAKLRNYMKQGFEKQFYTAKTVEEFKVAGDKYQKLLDFLKNLRTNGVCILRGEIENLFTDNFRTIMPQKKKLDLEKIFLINSKLNKGEIRISDILDCSEIKEFLESILN